ncbi:MAG TPA: tetratricopeptide repeat protein [Candidatus Eisenbacteria bacterium]|jgi:tetratricopeptide (TPR) repeat protein
MSTRLAALWAWLAIAGPLAASAQDRPGLLVPAQPDSARPESEPAPLLGPDRANPRDSTELTAHQRAWEQFEFGRTMEAKGRTGVAVVAYRNAARIEPQLRELNYRLGRLLAADGQLTEAMKCFATEVANHPDHEEAARELGLVLSRLGDHKRGISQLELLARRKPQEGKNWHALGFAYRAAGRRQEAETALRRAIRLAPDDAEEHRDLGALLADLGRAREAKAEYRRALALFPGDPSTWLNLGNLERRGGRPDSALVCYQRAEAGDSSFSLAYVGQLQLLRERSRLADAGVVYRRWLRHRPEEHGARLEAVDLFEGLHQPEVALEIAREGVQRVSDQGQPYVIYGMTLAAQGRAREALRQYRRAEFLFLANPAERARVRKLIDDLRRAAPDSLRGLFEADSAAAAAPPR